VQFNNYRKYMLALFKIKLLRSMKDQYTTSFTIMPEFKLEEKLLWLMKMSKHQDVVVPLVGVY
jgi:hypothetical protein